MSKTESIHGRFLEEEKGDIETVTVTDLDEKDGALKLVGLERAVAPSEEAYRRVRRKLVRQFAGM